MEYFQVKQVFELMIVVYPGIADKGNKEKYEHY